MASLYDITAGYASLIDAYDNADSDEEREGIIAMLASAEGEITEKAENYARVIRMKEEEAKAFKAEKDHEAEVKAKASDVYDVEGKRWLREKKLVQSIREKERRRGQR